MLLRFLLDRIIGQVREAIVDVVKREIVIRKSEVAFFVEPNFGRIEVLDKHPLPDIELPAFDKQRVLDILLDDELSRQTQTIVSDIVYIVEASNAPPS